MAENTSTAFRPVRGKEADILSKGYNEGYVYFATDTGNIFIDYKGSAKIPMGGRGAAVLYARGVAVQNQDNDYYSLDIGSLVDENATVKEGDLVINSDGGFYKVIEVTEYAISCERIAVSGSGSGTPGEGGSTTVQTARGRLTVVNTGETDILNGSEAIFNITATSATEDGVAIDDTLKISIAYFVAGSTVAYYSDTLMIEHGQTITYEATNFLRNNTETSISFIVSGSEANKFYSNGKVERTIITHNLSVEWVNSQFSNVKYFTSTIGTSLRFSTGAKRILDVYFDDALVFTKTYANSDVTSSAAPDITKDSQIYDLSGRPTGTLEAAGLYTHGRHKISAVMSLAKADGSRGSSTDTITKEIALYLDEGYPLIWFGDMESVYYEFDNPVVPIRVYDPHADASGVKVYLYADMADQLDGSYYTISNDSTKYLPWTITGLVAGQTTVYQVKVGEDEYETWENVPEFIVKEDPRNMGIATQALVADFNALGRSNAESPARRETLMIGDKKAEMSGFNWYNNGWVMDDDNNTCLRISNGASVTLPIGALSFAGNTPSHTIEMRLKIRNVQSYEKLITNYTRYCVSSDPNTVISATTDKNWKDDAVFAEFLAQRATGIASYDAYLTKRLPQLREKDPKVPLYDELGFSFIYRDYNLGSAMLKYIANEENPVSEAAICLGPQDGYFSNGTNAVTCDYVEDQIINLTIVYDNGTGANAFGNNKLMKFYLNGMLTSVARSTSTSSWAINTPNLIINSAGCDIDLYKFRVYDRALGLNEVLKNVAYDNLDTEAWDLSELYTANQEIDEDYQFSFNKMITYNKNNPDNHIMPYILFTTDEKDNATKGKLPWRKDTPTTATMEFVNPALDRAYATGELSEKAENAGMSVEDYYLHHCPSWVAEGVTMSVQGTSSEFYPRRNYKVKTAVKVPVVDENGATSTDKYGDVVTKKVNTMKLHKGPFAAAYEEGKAKGQKFFYYDNNTVGCNKFTLKIDYMESSGSYNMGLANLVNSAYSHHPLRDYNSTGSFVTGASTEGIEEVQTTFNAAKANEYAYVNHKGNWKFTDGTKNCPAGLTAEDFAKGPVGVIGDSAGAKVLNEATLANAMAESGKTEAWLRDHMNKWYIYQEGKTEYTTTTIGNLEDYRTSVQGFPTLAFYQTEAMKKAGTEPLFIGRYNMILDKGADEAYGFKPSSKILQNYIEPAKPDDMKPAVKDIAECWEFENNSRGFCSFRDPWNRRDLTFAAPEGASNALTSNGAPIVADYFEYRYNSHEDELDYFYDMDTSFQNVNTVAKIQDSLGAGITDTQKGGEAMLKLYSNWEKAVAWVWSTATDAVIDGLGPVPKLGSYVQISLGEAKYVPGEFFVEDAIVESVDQEGNPVATQTYKLCNDEAFDATKAYYISNSGGYIGIKLVADDEHVYEPSRYFTLENNNYVLAEDAFDASKTYYKLIEDTSSIDEAWRLPAPVTYGTTTYEYDTQEYRLAKFKNELTKHFNLEYLTTYFVITEVLECYDSRGKNAMFASWGPQEENGDYIWYPMFYDLDTQLGINNTGIPSFQYNIDATEDGTFSTNDSVLWNNFYALFRNLISDKYEQLTGVPSENFGGALENPPFSDINTIESWYSCNPEFTGSYSMMGVRPLLALNLDEQYKYISITNPKVGYMYQNGDTTQDTSNTYFYALQGSRDMSRQQFLTNRLNYIDSWLAVGDYKRGGANRIRSRVSANNAENTSDKWIEGTATNGSNVQTNVPYYKADGKTKTHLFDGEYWITMTPVRNMYVTVGTDTANFDPIKYSGTPIRFETPDLEAGVKHSGNYREQLYYIYGLDQMKSLGDLSRLYFQEFELSGKANKMIDLKLGYDGLDEEGNPYKNSGVNDWTIPAAAGSLTGGMPLLQEVNLCNITFKNSNNTFDFSSCEKLRNFRNTGSNITQVTFAEGVSLDTLYLTKDTTALQLIEARLLTNLITTYQNPVADEDGNLVAQPGLYIEGLTDGAKKTAITTFDIRGGNLGYNSYTLLKMYLEACQTTAPGTERKINLLDVQWSPYVAITDDQEAYNPNNSYFIDNGHFGLTEYTNYSAASWKQYINNGMMYQYDESIKTVDIADASIFEEMIDNPKYFSISDTNNTVPNVTGYVYINNDTEYDEGDIQNKLVKNFPGLHFFFKNVKKGYSARFVILKDGVETLIGTDKISRDSATGKFFVNPMLRTESAFSVTKIDSLEPTQDFLGWGTQNDRAHLVETYDKNWESILNEEPIHTWDELQLEPDNYDYTFYAIFEDHYWDINFYIVEDNGDLTKAYSTSVKHGTTLSDPGLLLSRNEATLAADKRYKFLGYTRKINGNNIASSANAAVVNLSAYKATSNLSFYALFYEESVYDAPTDEKYFVFTEGAYSDGAQDSSYDLTGYNLRPRDGVDLAGKITLPTTYNNKPIIGISGFSGQVNITHVYWHGTPQVRRIAANCFQNCSSMVYFQFPDSVRLIQSAAFRSCSKLQLFDFTKAPLYEISANAFLQAFTAPTTIDLIHLPGSIITLGANAIANNDFQGGVTLLQIGGPGDPSKLVNCGAGSTAAIRENDDNKVVNLIIYVTDVESAGQGITNALYGGAIEYTGTASMQIA